MRLVALTALTAAELTDVSFQLLMEINPLQPRAERKSEETTEERRGKKKKMKRR